MKPEHKGGYHFGNLWHCLPAFVCESLVEGIDAFGRKIKGYDRPDAILSGVETRTSSPVRILRDEHFESNVGAFTHAVREPVMQAALQVRLWMACV